jgi:serine/threonine-protein kinase HipA
LVSAPESGGRAALASACDFVATTPYIKDEAAALKFSRTARFDELTMDELAHLAGKARLPEKLVLNTAAETVALFHQQWTREATNLPLTRDVVSAVEHQLRIAPLATETR